jgi:hypothetical protein
MSGSALLQPRQQAALRVLLEGLGLPAEASLTPLAGGANNRVFRVDADGAPVLLKAYFRHPQDPRDRLGVEFAFCRFAWDNGVQVPPRPLAADADANLALYEFIEGEPVRRGQVSVPEVRATLDFYRALNEHRDRAGSLPAASEACFSVSEHLQTLERRLGRLSRVTDDEARDFVSDELVPAARIVLERVRGQLGEAPLAATDRRVSPSDFGFHNALRQTDGRLRFIDFEYAGWDDPAKVVCDFFCQPAVPVPLQCWDEFARGLAADLGDPAAHLARFAALLPVYRLKWCCILLNDFLPEGSARRSFSSGVAVTEEQRAEQLEKARGLLAQDNGAGSGEGTA